MNENPIRAPGRHARLWTAGLAAAAALLGFATWLALDWGDYGQVDWTRAEDPARRAAPLTAEILAAVDAEEGDRIADVGAGGGFFTFLIAEQVGPSGRVIAIDMDYRSVVATWLERRRRGLGNIESRWHMINPEAPALDLEQLDALLMVNTNMFGDCWDVAAFLEECARALVPGGRLVYVVEGRTGPDAACRDLTAAEVVQLAGPWFEQVTLRPAGAGARPEAGVEPGYLLALKRRAGWSG